MQCVERVRSSYIIQGTVLHKHGNTPYNSTNPIHNLTMHQSHTPQCTSPISHYVTFCNRNVHIVISVTKWCIVGYFSDALWDLWDWSILYCFNNLQLTTDNPFTFECELWGVRLLSLTPELLVCDLNRTPNCYGKTWRFLCPFFRNLHLRENLARDCFTSTVSTVTNSVQNIFIHLRYCDK